MKNKSKPSEPRTKYYFMFIYGCIEPEMSRAFPTYERCLAEALRKYKVEGDEHTYICLKVNPKGRVTATAFEEI